MLNHRACFPSKPGLAYTFVTLEGCVKQLRPRVLNIYWQAALFALPKIFRDHALAQQYGGPRSHPFVKVSQDPGVAQVP